MKKLPIILLLSLVLIPVIWNGAGFFHYVLEHTHTFCGNDSDHEHPSTDECQNICHLNQNQDHDQLPVKVTFYELNQFITTNSTLDLQTLFFTPSAIKVESSSLIGRITTDDIFRPPIL